MQDYSKYILNSDFSTISKLGNDASTIVTLPGGTTIASGDTWSAISDIPISGSGSFRCTISSSKIANTKYPLSTLTVGRTWSGGMGLTAIIFVYRLNTSTIRVEASVTNFYPTAHTSPAGNEVFTISVANMTLPF